MFKKFAVTALGGCLLVAVLCLGLLPVTALAVGEDAPDTLWVGKTQITGSGYWKTDTNGKLSAGNENNYNVYYDGNGTLTLNNANIQGGNDSQNPQPKDYGIYAAPTGNQSVSLTINLIGSNTVGGHCAICVEAKTGDYATLVIQSNGNDPKGSLVASGSSWNGISVLATQGNVSLTINNASVEASSGAQYYHGVSLISYTASNPELSLTVNGGSLTAQGYYGIWYNLGSSTNPSTSLTVSDGALIKAIPNISASISASGASKPTPQGNGIVFDGTEGTVYGDVTLDESLTINQGETLTIPQGSTLNTNGNLTNNGTIVNKGTMNGDPTGGSGTVVSTPAITTESLPDGTAGQSYTATLEATGNDITWSANGLPAGLTLDAGTGAITGTPTTDGQFPVTVTATNSAGSVDHAYTLSIKPAFVPVTGLKLSSESLTLQEKGSHTLTATVEPADATNKSVTWESSDTDIATVDDDGTVTAVSAGKATIIATAADGSGVSASCEVTVTHSDMVQTPKKDATCTAYGTEGYWTCGICGKHYKDEGGTVPTTPEESVIPATGHDYGEPAWSWSEDGAKATATFTCKNDGSHQATEDAAVTSAVKTPATCTEAGVTTYTATVEFNGKTYTSTKEVTDIPAAGHKLTKTEAEAPTCTEPGSAEYWTCGVCDKVFSDAAGEHEITPEDAVIPATGHEFEGGLCSVCGARDTSFSPALVSGDGAKWTKGSSKGLTFVSSAAFVDLVEVRLDGRVLSASEYAVREGSTIVTLPAKLLEGLKAGDHELLIVSGSGTVRASLTVAEAAKVEEAAKTEKASADELPASGDSTAPALAVAAAAAAGAGLVLLSRRRAAR